MKCPDCGTETKPFPGESETLVGYSIIVDSLGEHHHNDNCLTRHYKCTSCDRAWIESIVRRCNLEACGWKGRPRCFCHVGDKVDRWTDA